MQWNSGAPASAANFWVNLKCCSAEFHIASKHSEDLKNLTLKILKEKSLASWAVSQQLDKAFRIAHCKQPWLVKPRLNIDLNFKFKSSGTVLQRSWKSVQN